MKMSLEEATAKMLEEEELNDTVSINLDDVFDDILNLIESKYSVSCSVDKKIGSMVIKFEDKLIKSRFIRDINKLLKDKFGDPHISVTNPSVWICNGQACPQIGNVEEGYREYYYRKGNRSLSVISNFKSNKVEIIRYAN